MATKSTATPPPGAMPTATPKAVPATPAPSHPDLLLADPVVRWAIVHPLQLSLAALTILAQGIVSTLAAVPEDSDAALEFFGRGLFQLCFHRDDRAFGTALCDAIYDAALKAWRMNEPKSARQRFRLEGSYEALTRQGVPADVCALGKRRGLSIAGCVRLTLQDLRDPEDALENALEDHKLLAERCLFDAPRNRWWIQNALTGRWDGPYVTEAFEVRLSQFGLGDLRVKCIKSAARSFDTSAPVFGSEEDVTLLDGVSVRNTYNATTIVPRLGNWWDIFLLLVNLTDRSRIELEHLLDWLAGPLQDLWAGKPPRKWGTAIVFKGVQGAGKDTLMLIVRLLYAAANFVAIGQKGLDSNFHAQLRGALFLWCNEVMTSTNRSAETANFIKALIADLEIPIEQKYKDGENIANRFNVAFGSNETHPVVIPKDDRRFTVFHSSRRLRADVAERIYTDMDGPQAQVSAFFNFLLQRKVTLKIGETLMTPEKMEMQAASAPSEEKFIAEIIANGWLAVAAPWIAAARTDAPLEAENNGFVPASTLNDVYAHWCRHVGLKNREATKLGEAIRKSLATARPSSKRIAGTKVKGYYGIPFYSARDPWAASSGPQLAASEAAAEVVALEERAQQAKVMLLQAQAAVAVRRTDPSDKAGEILEREEAALAAAQQEDRAAAAALEAGKQALADADTAASKENEWQKEAIKRREAETKRGAGERPVRKPIANIDPSEEVQ